VDKFKPIPDSESADNEEKDDDEYLWGYVDSPHCIQTFAQPSNKCFEYNFTFGFKNRVPICTNYENIVPVSISQRMTELTYN
jgi:hypothetical protein